MKYLQVQVPTTQASYTNTVFPRDDCHDHNTSQLEMLLISMVPVSIVSGWCVSMPKGNKQSLVIWTPGSGPHPLRGPLRPLNVTFQCLCLGSGYNPMSAPPWGSGVGAPDGVVPACMVLMMKWGPQNITGWPEISIM